MVILKKINPDDIPDFDILCAGFPCQTFSIAGKKAGFNDKTKGNLFYDILKIIDKKNPNTLMLENVKNLQTINKGKVFKTIINELEKRNYKISYKLIDSKYYGSPQSRQRVFIICNKNKLYNFKDIKNSIVPVSKIIDKTDTRNFDYKTKYKLKSCDGKGIMKYKLINKNTGKGGRQGERVYKTNSYGPTICASSGGPGAKTGLYEVGKNIRTLNVKETLAMFGFKKSFKYNSLDNKNKMLFFLGNSIVVNVLNQLIKDLEQIL